MTAQITATCTIAAMNERLGVLAFGDSITNGGGELQWGVALQSWALWTARCLALPYSGYAVDGARVHDVVAEQLPGSSRKPAATGATTSAACTSASTTFARSIGIRRHSPQITRRRSVS